VSNSAPIPQSCHACDHLYAGIICPLCKEERPAYTAVKRMTEKEKPGPLDFLRRFCTEPI
jgi:hypothetical protein